MSGYLPVCSNVVTASLRHLPCKYNGNLFINFTNRPRVSTSSSLFMACNVSTHPLTSSANSCNDFALFGLTGMSHVIVFTHASDITKSFPNRYFSNNLAFTYPSTGCIDAQGLITVRALPSQSSNNLFSLIASLNDDVCIQLSSAFMNT